MGRETRRDRGRRRIRWAWLLLLFALFASIPTAQARETIRIGYVPAEGYFETRDDGAQAGMLYDYLEMLAGYMGVDFEYVPGAPDTCLQNLVTGTIDVTANVANGPFLKPAEGFVFSQQPVAKAMVGVYYDDRAKGTWRIGYYDYMMTKDALDALIARIWKNPPAYETVSVRSLGALYE